MTISLSLLSSIFYYFAMLKSLVSLNNSHFLCDTSLSYFKKSLSSYKGYPLMDGAADVDYNILLLVEIDLNLASASAVAAS